ncbi:MAG: hypothetical protein Q8P67_15435 [archaeon]|nr:hypothetical protein [archaeon]
MPFSIVSQSIDWLWQRAAPECDVSTALLSSAAPLSAIDGLAEMLFPSGGCAEQIAEGASAWHVVLAHALALVGSTVLTQPLRVVAAEQMSGKSLMSMPATFVAVVREQHPSALWKGLSATLLRRLAATAFSGAALWAARRLSFSTPLAARTPLAPLFFDALSLGGCAVLLSALELVELRMLLQESSSWGPLKYRHGVVPALRLIHGEEGSGAFATPLWPLLLGSLAWYAAAHVALFLARRGVSGMRLGRLSPLLTHVLLAAVAHPFLLLSSQMMTSNREVLPPKWVSPFSYPTASQGLLHNVRHLGPTSLWSGFLAAVFSVGLTNFSSRCILSFVHRWIASLPEPGFQK